MPTCGKCKARNMPVEHIRACHQNKVPLKPGVYRRRHPKLGTDFLYLVYPSRRDSSQLRVKEVNPHCVRCNVHAAEHKGACAGFKIQFHRSPGMLARLDAGMRLSREEVASLGRLWKFCLHCGAALTLPESVERGAGKTCHEKYGGGA